MTIILSPLFIPYDNLIPALRNVVLGFTVNLLYLENQSDQSVFFLVIFGVKVSSFINHNYIYIINVYILTVLIIVQYFEKNLIEILVQISMFLSVGFLFLFVILLLCEHFQLKS